MKEGINDGLLNKKSHQRVDIFILFMIYDDDICDKVRNFIISLNSSFFAKVQN